MSVEVVTNFGGFQREFEREIAQMISGQAMIFRGVMSEVLLETGKSSKRAPHNHSKPWGIPHNLSGNLGRSWKSSKSKRTGNKYTSSVFTNTKYAAALEFGFEGRGLEPRPYAHRSIIKAEPRMKRAINANAMIERAAARAAI